MARGPKTSAYLGARARGRNNALDLRRRCPGGGTRRSWTGKLRTQEHAAVAHDFFRVLDGEGDAEKLNFPQCREDFARFAEQHGKEFKVDPEEGKGRIKWKGDKRKRFIELVEELYQIIYAAPARAEEIVDTGQVNLMQGEVQGDASQGNKWAIDKGMQQSDDPLKFRSRESESAISPELSYEHLRSVNEELISMNGKLLSEKEELLSMIEALLS